jgi:ADP-ribose pyrophosphatase YjhB (NUDIX family)
LDASLPRAEKIQPKTAERTENLQFALFSVYVNKIFKKAAGRRPRPRHEQEDARPMERAKTYRYCPQCAGPLQLASLKPGEPPRLRCGACHFVLYLDPKIAACVIARVQSRIVLLKRAIPPAYGRWVIPGGFVDVGEPVPLAAAREVWEEVRLRVAIGPLVGVYSYPQVTTVVVVYAAEVIGGQLEAADEALDARLFAPAEIPWQDLAFSSTRDALQDYLRVSAAANPPLRPANP